MPEQQKMPCSVGLLAHVDANRSEPHLLKMMEARMFHTQFLF